MHFFFFFQKGGVHITSEFWVKNIGYFGNVILVLNSAVLHFLLIFK